jgi:5-enolpyruvylshikimate-3-phosphate synthase
VYEALNWSMQRQTKAYIAKSSCVNKRFPDFLNKLNILEADSVSIFSQRSA